MCYDVHQGIMEGAPPSSMVVDNTIVVNEVFLVLDVIHVKVPMMLFVKDSAHKLDCMS